MNAPSAPLYHLALPTDWSATFATGEYRTSTRGMTLDDVGFIHCSRRQQLEGTANRFYGDLDQLVVLTIDPDLVPSAIVDEPPEDGADELFPHIYGPLPIDAVTLTKFWIRDGERWSIDTL